MDPDAPPAKLDLPPAYAIVAQHVRRAIRLGTYGPGDKLPPERAFAEELGVSRVTLREAIRVLVGEGYIETRRGAAGGATVRERRESAQMLRTRVREELDDLLAVQEFRLANEPLAAERAATRLRPAGLELLEASITDIAASTTLGEFRRADSAFHLGIARAASCALITKAVEDARAALFDSLDLLDFEILISNAVKGHQAILAALVAGDGARARRAMGRHLQTTTAELDAILATPEEADRGTGAVSGAR